MFWRCYVPIYADFKWILVFFLWLLTYQVQLNLIFVNKHLEESRFQIWKMGTKFAFPRKSHPAHRLYILKRKMRANSEPNEPSERNWQKWAKFEPKEPNLPNSRWSSVGLVLINQIFSKKLLWSSFWLIDVVHISSMKFFILAQ